MESSCPDWDELLAGTDTEDTDWEPAWRTDFALACIGRFVDKRRNDIFARQYLSKPTPLEACFDAVAGVDDDAGRRKKPAQMAVLPSYLVEYGRDARIDAAIVALRRAREIEGKIMHVSGTERQFLAGFLRPLVEEQSKDFDAFALEKSGAVRVLPSGWASEPKVRHTRFTLDRHDISFSLDRFSVSSLAARSERSGTGMYGRGVPERETETDEPQEKGEVIHMRVSSLRRRRTRRFVERQTEVSRPMA